MKKPLGRGLGALIPMADTANSKDRLLDLDILEIKPNDQQPRADFDIEALDALVESVKARGVMQPLVVTTHTDGGYMLIAGERRWRAAGFAGLKTVPAIVIPNPAENDRLELALIENTQRDDLKPMELARAYHALMARCEYRQEDLAKVAGKSRSAVANTLRLLDLDPSVMEALEAKKITEGHARVFLTLDKSKIALLLKAIISRGLSVRQTEAMAKVLTAEPKETIELDPNIEVLEREFESFFGSKVSMKANKKDKNSGVIEIKYSSADELDKIVNKLRGESC